MIVAALLLVSNVHTFSHCNIESLHNTMKLLPRQFSIRLDLHESDSGNDIIPSDHPFCTKTAATAAAAFVDKLRDSSRPKMIVFDKDGTLGDCTASLRQWVRHMTAKIESICEDSSDTKDLIHLFYKEIGWDVARDDVVPSAPLAAGTWDDIVGLVHMFLMEHQDSMAGVVSKELLYQWHAELGDLHEHDTPLLDDLAMMMKECQELGYTVAVCTSDDRSGTDKAMRRWGIEGVVTLSICGDEVLEGKPAATPLMILCQHASSDQQVYMPYDCIVVGDTASDTGMARSANAGFCVGVLTGSGTVDHLLDTGAHLILPHVGYIPGLLKHFQQLVNDDTKVA